MSVKLDQDNQNTKRLSITITEELNRKLNAESKRTNKPVSQIIREMIEQGFTRNLLSDASKLQAPMEEKINNLTDMNTYLLNMIEGVYRSVNYLAQLGDLPSEVKHTGSTETVVKPDEVKKVARKKANQSYRKMKSSSLSLGDYLEEYLCDADIEDEEEEHSLSMEELQAQKAQLDRQMADEKFAKQMTMEAPQELDLQTEKMNAIMEAQRIREEREQKKAQENQKPEPPKTQGGGWANKSLSDIFGKN